MYNDKEQIIILQENVVTKGLYSLVNIVHDVHEHTNSTFRLQYDSVHRVMPGLNIIVKPRDVIHPRYTAMIPITNEEHFTLHESHGVVGVKVFIELVALTCQIGPHSLRCFSVTCSPRPCSFVRET